MSANYPQWSQRPPMPPLSSSGKIRVGYISTSMCHHVVGILSLGWLINHNHDQLEVYCYYCKKSKEDFMTEEFKKYSDVFYQNTFDLEAICQKISQDKLHILVFLDIGMEPEMTQIAGLRLAPIQCTTWLHPVTSGLPTIDYFISNQAMEAKNTNEHYSEKLIRLPLLGICYPQPTIPESRETRAKFNLPENKIIYLSSQTLSKYLPQYDYIFPTIAQQVPSALFVFCQSHISTGITAEFRQRLQSSFAEFNLDSQDYCLILPRLSHADYFQLNFLCDIFLDTFSWSGGFSSLDAIACNLPIVTLTGEFLRGRQSHGILSILGITETIADNPDQYLDIAIKLGKDSQWRQTLSAKIQANSRLLYDDQTGLRYLERFYQQLVAEFID